MGNTQITSEEIRSIRRRLGLKQTEAGKLIGGGPRAFTKYEAGTVKPAASVVKLLRLLEADPSMISVLKGGAPLRTAALTPSPIHVTERDVECLTDQTLPEFLRRLLCAEAQANSLPHPHIHVQSKIHVGDGGEDGRITWQGGPDHTAFLPSRFCQFQLKAGKVSPAQAAKDVLKKGGAVKQMVHSALQQGAQYIMLCAHPYVQQGIDNRVTRIREKLRAAGLTINDTQVEFRDAVQIAMWANRHPAVAVWLMEQARPGAIGPFRSWVHWAGRAEHHGRPWVEDERLTLLRDHLWEQKIMTPRKVVRVVGLSGVGKSRLVLEALGCTRDDGAGMPAIRDNVIYATLSETSSAAIIDAVQNLGGAGTQVVVVLDNCDFETHQILANAVQRRECGVSLVTIGDEIPSGILDETTVKIEEASTPVIKSVIAHAAPGLPAVDEDRLVRFSQGFPKIAILVGKVWNSSQPLANATDASLVDAYVLGRGFQDLDLVTKGAQLLAAFGLVRVESANDKQLTEVAELGVNLNVDGLYAALGRLVSREVVKRRGQFAILQPRPIALHLAERQWNDWRRAKWDDVLSGGISPELKVSAAQQLALLNTTDIAEKITKHACRVNGPFDSLEGVCKAGHAEVLSSLAEIDPKSVLDLIGRLVNRAGHPPQIIVGDVRGRLIHALTKIAFHHHTFVEAALLLLRLAETDGTMPRHAASGHFKALFPMVLGGTMADSRARLSVLDEAADSGNPAHRRLVVDALVAGCEMNHFSRVVGAEVQGSRPALDSWRPATNGEGTDYIRECVTRLAQFAEGDDEAGSKARSSLGLNLRLLVRHGFIDTVETVVRQITASVGYWPPALRSLTTFLADDVKNADRGVVRRVRALVTQLQPASLESRVRSLIVEPPMPEPEDGALNFEARYQRDVTKAHELVLELLQKPSTLLALLPQLSRGRQRMADTLGTVMADSNESLAWLEPIVHAVAETPEQERNFDMLSGFVAGLARKHRDVVEAFKERLTRSPELATGFPQICARLGVSASDIQLAIQALRNGSLAPLALNRWSQGDALGNLPSTSAEALFEVMLDGDAEAFVQVIELMGMYTFDIRDRLKGLHPQILKLAENSTQHGTVAAQWTHGNGTHGYHFERIMGYSLDKGRKNASARATALALAKALASLDRYGGAFLIKPLLPKLLSKFPEITWPLIGQAIVSDKRRAASLRYVLGDLFSFGGEPNPLILQLPEDVLFAWCHAHPDRAPVFVAQTVPMVAPRRGQADEPFLHPVMARLLEEFGEREDVQEAVGSSIYPTSWIGSPTETLVLHKRTLGRLHENPKPGLRRWVSNILGQLDTEIGIAKSRDQERQAQWEVQPNLG